MQRPTYSSKRDLASLTNRIRINSNRNYLFHRKRSSLDFKVEMNSDEIHKIHGRQIGRYYYIKTSDGTMIYERKLNGLYRRIH